MTTMVWNTWKKRIVHGADMTTQERMEFVVYLKACTMEQLYGVMNKEYTAHRMEEARLAREEINRREGM